MLAYYEGEHRGQSFALVIFIGTLLVAVIAIALKSDAVGVAALISAGGAAAWSMRRRSDIPSPPPDLAKGDDLQDSQAAAD